MSNQQKSPPAPTGGAAVRGLSFEDCDYGTPQLLQIFSCGKTTLFTEILPQLETYYEGTRVKATGRSVKAYRERKLAEPRQKRSTPQLRKPKIRNENGVTGKPAAP
jgi:hypothetical protein